LFDSCADLLAASRSRAAGSRTAGGAAGSRAAGGGLATIVPGMATGIDHQNQPCT